MARSTVSGRKYLAGRIRACIWLGSLLLWVFPGPTSEGTLYYWDPTPGDAALGGSGTWNATNTYWRPGSPTISPTFWPGTGPDKDIALQGTAGTITLVGAMAVNDIYVAPTIGSGSTFTLDAGSLLLDGAEPSQVDVSSGATLQIASSLQSTALILKTGLGTLIVDNTATNLTGGIMMNGGTLQLGASKNSASSVFRGAPLHLSTGTNLTAAASSVTTRIGTLTGTGNVNVGGSTLYVTGVGPADPANAGSANTVFPSGPVFSGSVIAGALNISGTAGPQLTLAGAGPFGVSTFAAEITSTGSFTVNSGSAFTLATRPGTAAGVSGSLNVFLRGGALILDASQGNPTGGQGQLPNASASIHVSGGTLVLVGSAAGTSESVGTLRLIGGATTVSVAQTSSSGASLNFTGFERLTGIRSTLDFRAEGGLLGPGSTRRITAPGLPNDPWITVNGTDYMLYSTDIGASPASYNGLLNTLSTSGSSSAYYTGTGSFEKADTATFSAKGIRLLPSGPGQSLVISGTGNIATGGVLLPGSQDYTISSTNTGGLANSGIAGEPRYIGVMEQGTTLNFGLNLKTAGSDLVKFGRGILDLRGSNAAALTSSATTLVINAGVVRTTVNGASDIIRANSQSSLSLRGGVLEIAGGNALGGSSADFTYALGTGVSKVNWATSTTDEGDGGFSAFGRDATVNIGGLNTPNNLTWDETYGIHSGRALIFGSVKSDALLIFQNGLILDSGSAANPYFARQIRVIDNPESGTDAARISGIISGGPNADLLKTGTGTLQLTGTNTLTGNIIVQEGVLQLGATGGTGAGAAGCAGSVGKVIVKGGVQSVSGSLQALAPATLRLGGSSTVTDRVNDTAPLVLEAGKLETGGLSERFGTLSVDQTLCIIDLQAISAGLTSDVIRFAASADLAWSGTLQIWNWNGSSAGGGVDQIIFGTSSSGLRQDQLVRISFYSDGGFTLLGGAEIRGNGEVVAAVPEPGTLVTCACGIALLLSLRRFRRLSR